MKEMVKYLLGQGADPLFKLPWDIACKGETIQEYARERASTEQDPEIKKIEQEIADLIDAAVATKTPSKGKSRNK